MAVLGGYGVLPYAGYGSGVREPPFDSIIFLEANDRNQVIACISDGTIGAPLWVYWNPAPAPWSEALASPDPSDYPQFYALGENGSPPVGNLESEVFHAPPGYEYSVAGMWVDFNVRPAIMDDHDGGLGDYSVGFTAYIEGWGIPGIETTSSGDSLMTSVVRSDEIEVAIDPATLSVQPWPHHRSVRLPTRLDGGVRSYRITLANVVGVELEKITPVGVTRDLRKA